MQSSLPQLDQQSSRIIDQTAALLRARSIWNVVTFKYYPGSGDNPVIATGYAHNTDLGAGLLVTTGADGQPCIDTVYVPQSRIIRIDI